MVSSNAVTHLNLRPRRADDAQPQAKVSRRPDGLGGSESSTLPNQTVVEVRVQKEAPSALLLMFRELEQFEEVSVFVHGSWADDTRTAFSDLDDLVIIDMRGLKSSPRSLELALARIHMRFLRIDPLQHHGHWILEAGDWPCALDESFIPLVVLEDAVRIQGLDTFSVRIDEAGTRAGSHRNIQLNGEAIRRFADQYARDAINVFHTKMLVGSILLAPAYVFQSRGHRVTKKEGIERAGEILTSTALETIEWASCVRQEWSQAIESVRMKSLKMLARLWRNPQTFSRVVEGYAPKFPSAAFPPLSARAVEALLVETGVRSADGGV